ncbi:hypothetical protein M3Y97_00537100 [Aphelenchoides bicaudatus]|nr:hypothetical protein M3Y97_00537100 [Aphelenchoides bicaudatus]
MFAYLVALIFFAAFNEVASTPVNSLGLSGSAAEHKMTCHHCAVVDFVPAYAKHVFDSINSSDFGEFSAFPKVCDVASAKECEAGEICAKKTNVYASQFQGNLFNHTTHVHMCVSKNMHGTEETPLSGLCYEDKLASKNVNGIQVSTSWCYCRNEEYCNSSNGASLFVGLMFAGITFLLSQ